MAPKLKSLSLPADAKQTVTLTHKCLSKYTHTDMEVLCSNPDFKTLFSYFLDNGMEFMGEEQIVQVSREHYTRALSEISSQQTYQEPVHSLNLDFID
jgi:transposase-like protein